MTVFTTTVPARGLTQPPHSNGAPIEAKIGAEYGWDQRVFTLGQDLQLDWTQRVPKSWDGGTVTCVARVRSSSVVNDCVFELHYEVVSVGSDRAVMATPVLFDAQKVTTVPGTADTDFEITFTDTPAVSPGDLVKFRLKRLGTLAADNTGDVNLTEVYLEWESIPKLSGYQSVASTGPITSLQFSNRLTKIDTSAGAVAVELPSLGADDSLKKGWFVREGINLAQITVPGGYSLRYSGGTSSPYDLSTDGDMIEILYEHSTLTYYIK